MYLSRLITTEASTIVHLTNRSRKVVEGLTCSDPRLELVVLEPLLGQGACEGHDQSTIAL